MGRAIAEVLAAGKDDALIRAEKLRKTGATQEALKVLREVVQSDPKSFSAQMMLADLHRAAGDKEDEAVALRSALEARPINPWPYIRLGRLAAAEDRHEDAVALLERALSKTSRQKDLRAIFQAFAHITSARYAGRIARPLAPAQGRPVQDAVVVSMLKDEEDIIFQQLKHHYLLGFRNFVLADNGSTDNTRARILAFRNEFSDARVFIIDDPVVGYYQDLKTTALAHYAVHVSGLFETRARWIFPLDADEFITPSQEGVDIKEVLQTLDYEGKKVCVFYLCDVASPVPLETFPPDADPFDEFSLRSRFLAKSIPKVAFSYEPNLFIAMGNHFVDNIAQSIGQIEVAARWGFVLTHFAIRSIDQARSKYINGGRAYLAAPERQADHGQRWQKAYRRYQEVGDRYFREMVAEYIKEVAALAG